MGFANREERLKQLLAEINREENLNGDRQQLVIQQIVNLALQSRLLCRSYKQQPLNPVSQDIRDRVETLLREQITILVNQNKFKQVITCQWLDLITLEKFRQILTDSKLKELALFAQRQPKNSPARSYALTELVQAIKISNRLCRPHKSLFGNDFYHLIYEEALVQTMTYICVNIDKYDPDQGQGKFLSWVNFKLDKQVLLCRRQFDLSHKYQFCNLPEFDTIPYQKQPRAAADLLYQYIEQDPIGILGRTYIKGKPQANFRAIALSRLKGKSWQEIANELKTKVSALSPFYQRTCQKYRQLLREELENKLMF